MQNVTKDENVSSKEERHLMIVNNLENLSIAIEELQDVLNKVRGQDVKKASEPIPPKPTICLAEFLEITPDQIEDQVAQIRDIREGFYSTLF
jgi:hypothetical protein